MNDERTILQKIRRTRFESDILGILARRHPQQHAALQQFSRQSEGFVQLRTSVLDHYFYEQGHLSLLFAVDAMVSLVERTLDIIQQGVVQQRAA